MPTRGKIILTFCFISLALILSASAAFSETATGPIKIGGSLPLTGIASEPAKWIKAGYEDWAEDINKKGGLLGRPVKLIIYDDESNAEKAVTYYERAITIDKADLIFGGYPGTANVALMPLAEKYKKVFIGMGGHLQSFDQGYTFTFASPPFMGEWTYLSLAGVLDDLIPKAQSPKTMAILAPNNVVGLSPVKNFIKMAEERGIKVVVNETYNLPLSDATPLVSKAKARGAEILCCMSFFDDAVMIYRTAKAINYNPKIVWQLIASTVPSWVKELGEDGNNVISSQFWIHTLPYPGNDRINQAAKELTQRYKLPGPPPYYGVAYSWMKTLELAVQGAGTLDNEKLKSYLRSHKFDLPYGKGITFDGRGLPPPFCFTTQITNGRIELLWPKEVATTNFLYPRPAWRK